MENEYQILDHLDKNQDTSQRIIAKKTGLSVGTVNLLIKKMVRKGLIKIERLNAKSLRYIITPQGIKEKTRLTYRYIKISYQQIVKIQQALWRIVLDHSHTHEVSYVKTIFMGPPDEILEILKISANNLGLNYTSVLSMKELTSYFVNIKVSGGGENELVLNEGCIIKPLVIIWKDEDYKEPLDIEAVNILDFV